MISLPLWQLGALLLFALSAGILIGQILEHRGKPTGLAIFQSSEDKAMAQITGVPAGGSGTFVEGFLPAGSALPAGAQISYEWSADDPAVVLTPSADGSGVTAAVPASDTQGSAPAGSPGSFNLTVTGTSAALPGPITGTANIPILPAVAPPLPMALSISQTA